MNTSELAKLLPRGGKSDKTREMMIYRLLRDPRVKVNDVLQPFAREIIALAATNDREVVLALDQTKVADGFECVAVGVWIGNRAVPIAVMVRKTNGNIGFDDYKMMLEDVFGMIGNGVKVMLAADRFYGNTKLIGFCQNRKWNYRIRLKQNLILDHMGGELTVGDIHRLNLGGIENARFSGSDISTSIGMVADDGHDEPWFIAMIGKPTIGKVLDYGMRWAIEAMFSDAKSRGFSITETKLEDKTRIERLLMLIAICFYFAVSIGMAPNPAKPKLSPKKAARSMTSLFKEGLNQILLAVLTGNIIP